MVRHLSPQDPAGPIKGDAFTAAVANERAQPSAARGSSAQWQYI
jgi:hypothetical protein